MDHRLDEGVSIVCSEVDAVLKRSPSEGRAERAYARLPVMPRRQTARKS